MTLAEFTSKAPATVGLPRTAMDSGWDKLDLNMDKDPER